jgi:hypothetical protein
MRFPYLTLVLESEKEGEELTDPQKTAFEASRGAPNELFSQIFILLMLDVHIRLFI